MRLREYYYDGKSYTFYNYSWYELVFEHNYSFTNQCFNNKSDAMNINDHGKYSILYDLNSTKYLMNDEYQYFILDYPNLNKINSWRQRNSPTVEEEVANVTKAEGFERYVTDLPMSRWGGLVLNKINNYSLLNGNPGTVWWHYAVAMLCNEEGGYLSKGYPASKDDISKHEFITDRIRLWAKRSEVFPKLVITCLKPNNYYLIHILFSLFIPVCLES